MGDAQNPRGGFLYQINGGEILRAAGVGFFVGGAATFCTWLLNTYIVSRICTTASTSLFCNDHTFIFGGVLLFVSFFAVIILINLRFYQPLLTVVSPVIVFWELYYIVNFLEIGIKIIVVALFFMFAYMLFYLLFRTRSVITSLIFATGVIIVLRLMLSL